MGGHRGEAVLKRMTGRKYTFMKTSTVCEEFGYE